MNRNNMLFTVHPDTLEVVKKEVNLDAPGRIDEALDILEEWVKMQSHFVKKEFPRKYLETTLVTAKGSVERAKQKIDKLCTLRTLMPEFFPATITKEMFTPLEEFVFQERKGTVVAAQLGKNLHLTEDRSQITLFYNGVVFLRAHAHLPKLTKEHYRIYLFKLKSDNFDSSLIQNYYKYLVLSSEYSKMNDYNSGYVVICDFMQINVLNFVTKVSPMDLRHIFTLMTDGYGVRIKSINIISDSKMVGSLVALFKQVLSAKLSSRLHVHKDLNSLYESIEKNVLPEDFGGKELPLQKLNEICFEAFCSKDHVEFFLEMNKAKTDETCRQADVFNEQYVGMPGSFRALSVD